MHTPPKAVKYLLAVGIVVFVLGTLGAVKGAQIFTMIQFGKDAERAGPPPQAVGAFTAEEQTWEGSVSAVGSVASQKGVTVSNEVPGVVTRIAFESGQKVKEGDVIVELDVGVERADLAAAVARNKLAAATVKRTKELFDSNAVAKEMLDTHESAAEAATAQVAAAKAQIERKTVRAPFAGRLGIRNVNLGQYLAPGTAVTVLESIDSVYVDFTLPQERLAEVADGMAVKVTFGSDQKAPLIGSITALDPSVDETTRSVRVRAAVGNEGERLRPGMFVAVDVILPKPENFVVVPETAVVRAAYGNSVFVLEEPAADAAGTRETEDGRPILVATQRFVRTGAERGDFVAVVEGLQAGEQVVVAGAFKLRNGARVVVTDKALPQPQTNPQPPNR